MDSSSGSGINTQDNARVKVSSWLSGLVEEVRKKSQTPVQKWIDNNQKEKSITEESTTTTTESSINVIEKSMNKIQCTTTNDINLNENNKEESKKVWSKDALLTKFNQSFDKTKTFEVRNFGRAKINEFYDRVRIDKVKYNFMKFNRMEINEEQQKTDIIDREHDDKIEEHTNTDKNVDHNNDDNDEDNKHNDGKSKQDFIPSEQHNISNDFSLFNYGLHTIDDNDDETIKKCNNPNSNDATRRNSTNLPNSSIKNHNLGNIGRSFSEAADDEDDDLYLLNERSQSYSHVVNNRNVMSLISDNKINSNSSNSVSHSLPSFFERKTSSATLNNPLLRNLQAVVTARKSPSLSNQTFCKGDKSDNSRGILFRDSSIQSDSSHCSSVESLLESRKPDPEAILINLGFGPVESEDIVSRIPKRFLKPSQVRGIDTEAFLKRQQHANHLHDHSVLGYRGLVGNPDIPPSTIVAKIMERFEQNERKRCIMDINMNRPQSAPPTPSPNSLN